MTNKEKYKKSFAALHTSAELLLEVRSMEKNKKRPIPRWAAACAAIVMTFGLSLGVYAADIGGIQRAIQIWRHGEQTDAVLEFQDGNYSLSYEDENGKQHSVNGHIVVDEGFTTNHQHTGTIETVVECLQYPDVIYEEDGSVWVYCKNQKIDITDQFDEEGMCYLTLKMDDTEVYMTIKYKGSFAFDKHKYPSQEFLNKK